MKRTENFMKSKIKLIVFIILGVLLCIANFAVLLILDCKGKDVSILATIISGWISGIATLCVGLIAYYQNKKINKENNRIVTEQAIMNKKLSSFYSIKDKYFQILEMINPSILNLKVLDVDSGKKFKSKTSIDKIVIELISNFHQTYLNFETLLYSDDFNTNMNSIRDRVHKFYDEYFAKLSGIIVLKSGPKYQLELDKIFEELDKIFKGFKKDFNAFIIKTSFNVEKDYKKFFSFKSGN